MQEAQSNIIGAYERDLGKHLNVSDLPKISMIFVSLFNHLYWISGCILGSLIGNIIQLDTRGIEFSMTALFVTVFVKQWLTTKNHLPSIIGLICSFLCLVIFGPGKFLIPSMITITVVIFVMKYLMRVGENG